MWTAEVEDVEAEAAPGNLWVFFVRALKFWHETLLFFFYRWIFFTADILTCESRKSAGASDKTLTAAPSCEPCERAQHRKPRNRLSYKEHSDHSLWKRFPQDSLIQVRTTPENKKFWKSWLPRSDFTNLDPSHAQCTEACLPAVITEPGQLSWSFFSQVR